MKKHQRITGLIIILILLCSFSCISYAENENKKVNTSSEPSQEAPEKNTIEAKSPHAVLMDLKTGTIIYEKNSKDAVYPAGLTNIMTAVLVLENSNMEELATASETALSNISPGDNKMGILKEEKLSVRQLVYGMLLESASDAANVLAEKTAGSIEAFVNMMNARARELGMEKTSFTNPTGNHDDRHYTTPMDMAILARHAMSIHEFCDIVKCDSYTIPPTEKNPNSRKLTNRNHLVSRLIRNDYYYANATGLKTGYSAEAKSCVAASAQKGSMSLLALVFEADTSNNVLQSYDDCRKMFDFVFANYVSQAIVSEGDIVAQTNIINTRRDNKIILTAERQLSIIREKDSEPVEVTYKDLLRKSVSAPVKKGEKIGTREYFANGQSIGTLNLLAEKNYKLDPVTFFINKLKAFFTSPWLYLVIFLLIVFFILAERRRRRILRKKRRDARKKRNLELIHSIDR